ncbi:MAG: hypothetical protein JNM76_03580 [Betaproteobacteria bacterium]|nr:hypothetical protein [Betaproteobacteria bacterium]
MNRLHFRMPLIASTALLLGGLWSGATLAEVGDKRAKCADGIGCSDASPPKTPPAKKPETQIPRTDPQSERSTRNDGAGRIRQDSSTTRAQNDLRQRVEECSNRQQQSVDYRIGARQRVSNPELNASQCIRLGDKKGLYGPGFVNSCQYPVQFKFCAYRPKPDSWVEAFDCEKTKGGTELIQPGQSIAAHTSNAEYFYWAGCKHPEGTPADFKFVAGKGYEFRCYAWDNQAARESSTSECNSTELVKKVEKQLADEKALAAAQAAARQKAAEQKEALAKRANEQLAQELEEKRRLAERPPIPTSNSVADPCQAQWAQLDTVWSADPRESADPGFQRYRYDVAARLKYFRGNLTASWSSAGPIYSYEDFRRLPLPNQLADMERRRKIMADLRNTSYRNSPSHVALYIYQDCLAAFELQRIQHDMRALTVSAPPPASPSSVGGVTATPPPAAKTGKCATDSRYCNCVGGEALCCSIIECGHLPSGSKAQDACNLKCYKR